MTRRLLLSYLIIAVTVLVVLEVPLAFFYQQRESDRLAVDAERDATVLASIYEDALQRKTALDPATATDYASRTGVRVVVVDKAGISLIDTADVVNRDFATRPEIQAALSGNRASGTRRSDTLNTDILYVAVPVASGGQVFGAVRLTLDTSDVDELVRRFWLGLAGVAAVVLTAIAGLGWAIARSVNRPLRELHDTAARFATGDLATSEPDLKAPPEIAELGATMNTMAQRLGQLIEEQRAFVADASHQLRTPLTALRLRLENVQSSLAAAAAGAGGAGERRAAAAGDAGELNAAIDETARLASLVNDLLKLARAEETAVPAPVDLVQLARDRVDTWSAIADVAGITLDLAAPNAAVVVSAVPTGVEQILDNLIDNAVTASPSGTHVSVTVGTGGTHHQLSIADQGLGLSDELKARALDRFWRSDHATPGTGLGLPIARALAEASGGSLRLHDGVAGGLVVTVALPAARTHD